MFLERFVDGSAGEGKARMDGATSEGRADFQYPTGRDLRERHHDKGVKTTTVYTEKPTRTEFSFMHFIQCNVPGRVRTSVLVHGT